MIMQDISSNEYDRIAQELVQNNADMVKAIKEKGQQGKIMWFVGQMMKIMTKQMGGGGVKPDLAKAAIVKALELSNTSNGAKN